MLPKALKSCPKYNKSPIWSHSSGAVALNTREQKSVYIVKFYVLLNVFKDINHEKRPGMGHFLQRLLNLVKHFQTHWNASFHLTLLFTKNTKFGLICCRHRHRRRPLSLKVFLIHLSKVWSAQVYDVELSIATTIGLMIFEWVTICPREVSP